MNAVTICKDADVQAAGQGPDQARRDAGPGGRHGQLPPLVPDLDADPLDGIPVALRDAVGSYDRDTAGGCG